MYVTFKRIVFCFLNETKFREIIRNCEEIIRGKLSHQFDFFMPLVHILTFSESDSQDFLVDLQESSSNLFKWEIFLQLLLVYSIPRLFNHVQVVPGVPKVHFTIVLVAVLFALKKCKAVNMKRRIKRLN